MRYCKSTIFQANHNHAACWLCPCPVVCDTAKVRFFKQITTAQDRNHRAIALFAILQKYDFSSKSQLFPFQNNQWLCCLRYCKSTIFQANHNVLSHLLKMIGLFAILQKYDFSSKSQLNVCSVRTVRCCLRYCKSTIFQANHNQI